MNKKHSEHQRRMRIGKAIAAALTPIKTQEEVAKELGISRVMVGKIEALALYKLFALAHKMRKNGEMESYSSTAEGERSFFNLAQTGKLKLRTGQVVC